MTVETLATHQLRPRDLAGTGLAGLRARPMRAVLSALGIAIGIAAMVGVVGISASGRARLDAELARLGTNLLTATPGQTLFGDQAELPDESVAMAARIGPVTAATATGLVQHARVYRNDRIPATNSNGIAVLAARTDLLHTVGGTVRGGRFLSAATDRYPAAVLGATTARLLGLPPASTGTQIKVGNRWFTVVGVLNPVPLAPELDDAALVGWPVARQLLGFDGHPTTVYERSADAAVPAVESVLAATVNPAHPDQVVVSRPSDALAARAATNTTFTELLLGLGAVALLVGGVGVANTMVISVLERRAEIGLRRALGATRGHVRVQFLAESLLLSLLGGTAGVLLGIGVTVCYAAAAGTPVAVPSWALAGGIGATVVIGGLAGLYPATRAAGLSPTEALAAP